MFLSFWMKRLILISADRRPATIAGDERRSPTLPAEVPDPSRCSLTAEWFATARRGRRPCLPLGLRRAPRPGNRAAVAAGETIGPAAPSLSRRGAAGSIWRWDRPHGSRLGWIASSRRARRRRSSRATWSDRAWNADPGMDWKVGGNRRCFYAYVHPSDPALAVVWRIDILSASAPDRTHRVRNSDGAPRQGHALPVSWPNGTPTVIPSLPNGLRRLAAVVGVALLPACAAAPLDPQPRRRCAWKAT